MGALIVAAIAGSAFAATTTGVAIATAINVALAAALSFGAQALLSPKAGQAVGSRSIDNLKDIARTNALPARIVFGRTRLSGLLVYAAAVDSKGMNKPAGRFLYSALASDGTVISLRGGAPCR